MNIIQAFIMAGTMPRLDKWYNLGTLIHARPQFWVQVDWIEKGACRLRKYTDYEVMFCNGYGFLKEQKEQES